MLTSLHLNEKKREVCIKARSTPTSLVFTGQVPKQQLENGLFTVIKCVNIFKSWDKHQTVYQMKVTVIEETKRNLLSVFRCSRL